MVTTTPARASNGMATAGMVCGIVGIVGCWLPLLGPIAGLLGIIFGAIGMSRAGRLGGAGRGAGIAGLVCGIVAFLLTALMAAIAIPAFLEYTSKAKATESSLQLKKLERAIKAYANERGELPPSTQEMPNHAEDVCSTPDRKHAIATLAAWDQAGWTPLDFWVSTPSAYSYRWTRESASHGVIEARADLDCDGQIAVQRVDVSLAQGTVSVEWGPPPQD